ncbi:long-chain fatty acid--CoA ligase [Halodesulfovibrio sp.]|jgi:long-chain acyl-CoA synthetase|uniref:long-chain-fatty-acid--CoA ligase n=1 Tax=Halodesulfovibrio sp. TaxID=1912772 RepID=UPI0025EE5E7F|nr:long-chain fatty acid--CoA ligase [Halodesulfovibrio sp.]MCT4627916.1 long-chain fatty acid--CoA ligase [Halodesulfovibrio sp.]
MNEQDLPLERPWLDNYDPSVPANIQYKNASIPSILDEAAKNTPKRNAVVFKNYSLTYKKLHTLAERFAANLRDQGVKPGDRVSIMMPNLPQTMIAFWGVLKAGGIVVMTNPLYMEKELVHQIHDSGAKHMITLDLLWPKIAKLRDKLSIEKYFVTRISDALCFPLNTAYTMKSKWGKTFIDVPYDNETVLPWKTLFTSKEQLSVPVGDPKTSIALLQYTGGTTGISKGVMLSHANLTANVEQCQSMLSGISDEHHTFLGLLPYFHVFGLTVSMLFPCAMSATVIPFPRYIPKDVLDGIQKYKPTIFPGAPSVYISLMQQKSLSNYDLRCIKYCISGSSPMPVEQMRQFKEITGAKLLEGFGLTEASPVTHLNPLLGVAKNGSIGLPFPDTDARIVDMEVGSVPLPVGKIGELILRGPQVMMGYWNRPDETASTLRNGWLYTGDIATMDEEGYFYIVDRKKDMIIVAGYNVYPREIDEVLYEHPKVQEAVTVGVPHKTRGEIIKVYIVPKVGEELTKAEILSHCREKLANYKVPKQVEFRDELPKTIVGKVLRRALRDEEEKKLDTKKSTKKAECSCPAQPAESTDESAIEQTSAESEKGVSSDDTAITAVSNDSAVEATAETKTVQ